MFGGLSTSPNCGQVTSSKVNIEEVSSNGAKLCGSQVARSAQNNMPDEKGTEPINNTTGQAVLKGNGINKLSSNDKRLTQESQSVLAKPTAVAHPPPGLPPPPPPVGSSKVTKSNLPSNSKIYWMKKEAKV